MRHLDDGRVRVKIGGAIRGKVFTKSGRAAAVRAFVKHYDAMLLRALRAQG